RLLHLVLGPPCRSSRQGYGCSFRCIAGRHSFGRILPRRSQAAKKVRTPSSQPRQPVCELFASLNLHGFSLPVHQRHGEEGVPWFRTYLTTPPSTRGSERVPSTDGIGASA